jgi:DNA primase
VVAGRIKPDDVALVKERTSIEDVVREHVTLRRAGPGSLKGLCPFHDEKTPSFTVRPAFGTWHCFGCDEGGDVLAFVQKVEHLSFAESVERLAGRAGVELHYEEGGGPRGGEDGLGRRARLVEAHRASAEFYHQVLLDAGHAEARAGRDFLRARGFDSSAAATFGIGYAPRSGEALAGYLTSRGFAAAELVTAGLVALGRRGPYDRFRGRLLWPIRDITGDTVGFGARRLFDDDRIEAKYLNTSETPIYRKTSVLYGLDLAKRAIASQRQVVIVEGYTDVMACHLAGVTTAVATCGTAFGVDHIKTLRRILRDEAGGTPARTVFTFDGDAAGQKAAMRAFEEDQRWASQSYVAVADAGLDPCELRQRSGDEAVRGLIADAVPMFEFAVRTTLARFDLATAEGRVQAMRAVAPMVAAIRDQALRPEYTRTVAGWLGVEVSQVAAEVQRAPRGSNGPRRRAARVDTEITAPERDSAARTGLPSPNLRNPVVDLERQFLQVLVQHPASVPVEAVRLLDRAAFTEPVHQRVFEAAVSAWKALGGAQPGAGVSAAAWVDAVVTEAAAGDYDLGPVVVQIVSEQLKAVAAPGEGLDPRFVSSVVNGLREVRLVRQIAEATSALQRMELADPEQARTMSIELTARQRELAELRAEGFA